MTGRPELTHCPHCGRKLWDERLDNRGVPILDTIWEMPTDNAGPGRRLRITEVEPENRFGRDIRGYLCYKTKAKGTEYDVDNEEFYTTSIESFHKIWVRDQNAPRDNSLFASQVS